MTPAGLLLTGLCLLPTIADAHTGQFGPVIDWPLIPIHQSLLPDGRLISYGTDGSGNQTGQFIYDVWDPSLGTGNYSHFVLQNTTNTDIFCSGITLLSATGQSLITGGDNPINGVRGYANPLVELFDPDKNTLQSSGQMNYSRWYGSLVALPDERAIVLGGRSSSGTTFFYNTVPEIYDPNTKQWDILSGLDNYEAFGVGWYYPKAYVIPGGTIVVLDQLGPIFQADVNADTITQMQGMLPLGQPILPSISYAPGKILSVRNDGEVVTVDFTANPPIIADTTPLDQAHIFGSLSVLPDGKILLTGGSTVDDTVDPVTALAQAAYQAMIWDPDTGQWTPDAAASLARMYHSNNLLLPDASVLVAGGGAPGPLTNLNGEIYYPSYLYTPDGLLAPRPNIPFGTTETPVGGLYWLWSDTYIDHITLVRFGSATHNNNSDQRYIGPLSPYHSEEDGGVDVPWGYLPNDPTVLIPGYYMMFAWSTSGTPSVAQIIHITP